MVKRSLVGRESGVEPSDAGRERAARGAVHGVRGKPPPDEQERVPGRARCGPADSWLAREAGDTPSASLALQRPGCCSVGRCGPAQRYYSMSTSGTPEIRPSGCCPHRRGPGPGRQTPEPLSGSFPGLGTVPPELLWDALHRRGSRHSHSASHPIFPSPCSPGHAHSWISPTAPSFHSLGEIEAGFYLSPDFPPLWEMWVLF